MITITIQQEKQMDVEEEERTIRKIVSRLYFIRKDLEDIEKIEIRSKEVREDFKEIRSKIEKLWEIFFEKVKNIER